MKKVRSVLGAPLRLVGRLARPLGRLRGAGRIIALAVVAVAVVAAVLVLRPGRSEDGAVREALERYGEASRDKDYQALCDGLLASELVDRIRAAGLPCEVALRTGLEDRRNPTLTVIAVEVNGDQALARVSGQAEGEQPAQATFRLVREGDAWKIASPGGAL